MPLLSADSGKPDAEDEATLPLFSDQSEPARSRPSTGRSVSSLGIARTVEHTSPVATIPFQKLLFRQPHQNYVECAFRRRLGTIVGRSEIGALITGYSIKRERYGPIICQFGSSPARQRNSPTPPETDYPLIGSIDPCLTDRAGASDLPENVSPIPLRSLSISTARSSHGGFHIRRQVPPEPAIL